MKRALFGLAILICSLPLMAEQPRLDAKLARMTALVNDPIYQAKIAVRLAALGRQDLLSPESSGPIKAVPSGDKATGQIIGTVSVVGDYFDTGGTRTVLAIVKTKISGFTDYNIVICYGQTISGQCKALKVNKRVKIDGELLVQYDDEDDPTLDYWLFVTKRTL